MNICEDRIVNIRSQVRDPRLTCMECLMRRQKALPTARAARERICQGGEFRNVYTRIHVPIYYIFLTESLSKM